MPKLKNVSSADLVAADEAASDLLQTIHDLTDRIEKTYVDPIDKPLRLARTFAALANASSGMVSALLMQEQLDEQRREIAALKSRLTP